ncbi:MAG: hypothetical protein IJA27_00820 [Lachnospiraceae bacterium]|nr:hypothetical protein [Lachnospiraceae bacterium]
MGKILVDYNNLSDKEKKEYQNEVKQLYITLGIATLLFYVVPFLLMFLGELGTLIMYATIINVYTVFSFMAGFMHSRKYDFHIIVPAAVSIFFIPTIMIFYRNLSLIGLALLYFVLGLFGEFTGHLLLKRKKNKRQPLGLNRLINGKNSKGKEKKAKVNNEKAKNEKTRNEKAKNEKAKNEKVKNGKK